MDRNFFDRARQAFRIPTAEERRLQRRVGELVMEPRIVEAPRIFPLNLWGEEPTHLPDCESGTATLALVHTLETAIVSRGYAADEIEVSEVRLCCLACKQRGENLLEGGNPLAPDSVADAMLTARSLLLRAVFKEQLTKLASSED